MDNNCNFCKVVIIGAGAAGISAARHLADNSNFDILVLDANPERYGGRIWSYDNVPGYPGHPIDLGAMWIHGGTNTDHPLTQLCRKFQIPLITHGVDDWSTLRVFDLSGQIHPVEEFESVDKIIKELNMLKNEFIETKSDDITFDRAFEILSEKYPEDMNKSLVRLFGIPDLESFNGAPKTEISLIHSDGVPESKDVIHLEGRDALIPTGYKSILDKLVTEGRKFEICLDRQVTRIRIVDERNSVEIFAKNDKNETFSYVTDYLILTVSLGILKSNSISFEPSLPKEICDSIENIGFGGKVKVILVFERVFWPNVDGLGAEEVNPTGYPLFFINLHKIHGLPALLCTIGGSGVPVAEGDNEKEILDRTLKRLKAMFGDETVTNGKLLFHKIIKWNEQKFVRGAYSYAKIGMTTADAYNIRKPIKSKIFFAGEHTMFPEAVHGTVHAAYLSGLRSAEEIIKCSRNDLSTSN